MQRICIVPARGGSKGIPNKNLRSVGGKPLIVWSIEQALASGVIDRVVVSTDSPEIAEVAKSHGAEVPFLRPDELATDTAATEPVLIHALLFLHESEDYRPDEVLLLQPTCPVRSKDALKRAVELFESSAADSLLSVKEIHPFLWRGGVPATAMYDYANRPRRQDVAESDRIYEETGSVYLTRTDLLLKTKNRLGGRIVLFPMSSDEAWDIDTEADLLVADLLLRNMK